MQEQDIPYDLIAKALAGQASANELAQLEQWRSLAVEHEQEWIRMERLWHASQLEPAAVDADKAWEKVKHQLNGAEVGVKSTFMVNWIMRIAAVLIIGLIAWWVLQLNTKANLPIVQQSGTEVKELAMLDGSTVQLNKASQLSYSFGFSKDNREVELKGEAYFEIAPDAAHPFVVHANGAGIKVIGTAFNVRALEGTNEVRIDVTHGKVLFFSEASRDSVEAILIAGESAILNTSTNTISKLEEPSNTALFWKNKTLIFKAAKLSDVVLIINDMYATNVVLANPKLSDCQLTTTFENQPLNDVLRIVAATLNLNVQQKDNAIELQGEGC